MFSTYLNPVPVLKMTTESSGERWPDDLSFMAAVGISGPIGRLKPSMFKALAGHVVAAAQGISVGLGANPLANQQFWSA